MLEERQVQVWKGAKSEFCFVKGALFIVPILVLPNFDKLFEVKCDASEKGIGDVLS